MSSNDLLDYTETIDSLKLASSEAHDALENIVNVDYIAGISTILTIADHVIEKMYAINDLIIKFRNIEKGKATIRGVEVEEYLVPTFEMVGDYISWIPDVCKDPNPDMFPLKLTKMGLAITLDSLKHALKRLERIQDNNDKNDSTSSEDTTES